ncbi:sucrose-6-phosphate hydrolase [Mesobacillus foraminis]|uniref:glycoside hydrolase family 32 protein n=1 Tax=Mesobacillus foraminis TaxID=279826 RepID=UPI00399FE661
MTWTKEQRYRKIEDVPEQEMSELSKRVNASPWRQLFHIQPVTGLLNDPNGFSFYNGEYHLFYQWFPLGPVHGLKYWYHTTSRNLVHWENAGIALAPDDYFDSHGAYSGSAIEHENQLYLMYTGNTRDKNWRRHPYQCVAVMDETGEIEKLGPVIPEVPEGYTDHFRDPKVWKENGFFYAVIGAQRENETGCVLLFKSSNLKNWDFEGEIQTSLKNFGYMWECPDYFTMEDHGILVFSPQGLTPDGDHYNNIYQSGYLIGETLNLKNHEFRHGPFTELDRGFDFYAPQSMEDSSGRRILVGWMGLPEMEYPTDRDGWAHCLTIPRELTIKEGKLFQNPVEELKILRGERIEMEALLCNEWKGFDGFQGTAYEMEVEFSNWTASEAGIELRTSEKEKTLIKYDSVNKKIVFDRSLSGQLPGEEFGTTRSCQIDDKGNLSFRIFVDTSSVEIFVNEGEAVFTGRIFPGKDSKGIRFFAKDGHVQLKAVKWDIMK